MPGTGSSHQAILCSTILRRIRHCTVQLASGSPQSADLGCAKGKAPGEFTSTMPKRRQGIGRLASRRMRTSANRMHRRRMRPSTAAAGLASLDAERFTPAIWDTGETHCVER